MEQGLWAQIPQPKDYNYYTPELDELFVGYECEVYRQANNKLMKDVKWHKLLVDTNYNSFGETVAFNTVKKLIKNNFLRTQRLTQFQIENLGYKLYAKDSYGFPILRKFTPQPATIMDSYDITVTIKFMKSSFGFPQLEITKKEEGGFAGNSEITAGYRGECKSINEFKKLVKVLGL